MSVFKRFFKSKVPDALKTSVFKTPLASKPLTIPKEVADAFNSLQGKMGGFTAFVKKGADEVNKNSTGFTDEFVKKTKKDAADSANAAKELRELMDTAQTKDDLAAVKKKLSELIVRLQKSHGEPIPNMDDVLSFLGKIGVTQKQRNDFNQKMAEAKTRTKDMMDEATKTIDILDNAISNPDWQ